MAGFPWAFSGTPAEYRRPAPKLGQHTDEILLELGISKDELAELRKNGAVG